MKQIYQQDVIVKTEDGKTRTIRLTPLQQKASYKEFQNAWYIASRKEKPRLIKHKPDHLWNVFSKHLTAFSVKNMPVDLQDFLTAVKTPYPEYANYFEFVRTNVDIFIFCRTIYDKQRQRRMTGLTLPTYFDEFYFPRQRVIFMNSYYEHKLRYSLGSLYFYASFTVHETRHKLDQNLFQTKKLHEFVVNYLEPFEQRANIEQLRFAAAAEKIFPNLHNDTVAHDLLYLDILPEIKKYNQALHLKESDVELEHP